MGTGHFMGRFTGVIFLNSFFSPFLTLKQIKDEQNQISVER